MKKIRAFTLAETLITLMVIGVVAALTIPSLMQTYKDNQFATARKKAMATIGNGFKLMIANNDGVTEGLPLLECEDNFECLSGVFHKSFQIGTDKTKTHEGLAEKYTKNGDSTEEAGFKWDDVPYIFTTSDGMTYGYLGGYTVVVDVNGNKSPNKVCKDIFKLTYGNGTVKDTAQDENDTEKQLCEQLDNGLEESNEGDITTWAATKCTEELKGCWTAPGGIVTIYDATGNASIRIINGSTCIGNPEYCTKLGFNCNGANCTKH